MNNILKRALSLSIAGMMTLSSIILYSECVFAAPTNEKHIDKTSDTPTVEIEYETGSQNNAKSRRDDTEKIKSLDDGSYEVIIPFGEEEEPEEVEWEEIHIKNEADFSQFAKNCKLDTWSRNKNVYLDNDIMLTGAEIKCIPTFGGHFNGRNYKITGYTMHEAKSYTGLFNYVQEGAVIENVVVEGSIKAEGKQIVTGGLVGENRGEIRNCIFEGALSGENYVGGIAGYNELTGNIINCRSIGTITGSYFTGGIVGENVGNISSCINNANINTVAMDHASSMQDFDISTYADGILSKLTGTASEKQKTQSLSGSGSVDTGGIAGLSIGVIQFCENTGEIGYEHVGYNIGGIVGRQSGYVHGCKNMGIIRGRKDVGGIVGQAEPYVVVDFTEDVITKLSDNINKLHDIIDDTLSDAGVSSDTISSRLSVVKQFTDKALNETSFLSNKTIDWTNGMVGAGNELMSRAQYIMSETSKDDGPIDNSSEAFDDTKKAAGHLEDAVNDLDIYKYMSEEQKASYIDSKERVGFLSKELTDNEKKYQKAAENYYIIQELSNDTSETIKYPESHDLEPFDKDGNNLSSDMSSFGTDLDAWANVATWRHGPTASDPEINTKEEAIESDRKLLVNAGEAYNSAVLSPPDKSTVNSKVDAKTKEAYIAKYGSMSSTTSDEELVSQAENMANIIMYISSDMDEATSKDAKKAAESLKNASGHLSNAGGQTKSIIKDVASKGGISMPTLGDDYRNSTNALNAALQGMSDNMGALNEEMSNSSDVMLGDMSNVNDQFSVIMQLYTDAIDGVLDGDYEDTYEDSSMEVAETCVDATIADCENTGKIEGDIDVAGIAGAMGVEYDFDLESDLTRAKDTTFNASYQSKCVLRKNKNNSHVTAQKNNVGGICGLQEIGTVLLCESYGKVKSNSSNYVGGISGESLSYIQKSVAKCFLSGKNYIGGIAGHGNNILNCYAMVDIYDDEADSYYGAIAGDVTEEGRVHYNYFVSDKFAGIDRISYKGQAEPIDYNSFIALENIPEECRKLYVIFYIDDIETDRIETTYGGSISFEQFPNYVSEDGKYCNWNKSDIENMTFDVEVEGEYTRHITSLASDQLRENGQSAVLVDGTFIEDDKLSSTLWGDKDIPLENVLERWELSYPSDANEKHLIRYKNPDGLDTDTDIYINNAGKWNKISTDEFGAYKTFEIAGPHLEFAVVKLKKSYTKTIVIAIIATLAALTIIIIIASVVRRKKRLNTKGNVKEHKDEKTDKETDSKTDSETLDDLEMIDIDKK